MFRPIRTIFLMVLVFLGGVFFERSQYSDRCTERGGEMRVGLCHANE